MMAVMNYQQLGRAGSALRTQWSAVAGTLRRLPWAQGRALAELLVLLYCCWVLARLFWLLLPLPEIARPGPDELPAWQPTSALVAPPPTVDIEALAALHLFGRADQAGPRPEDTPIAPIAAEETQLDLRLLGVVVSDQPSAARAIISHRNQQALFALGDSLPGGSQVALHQVLPGRVIINNAGRFEALWLYQQPDVSRGLARAVGATQPGSTSVPRANTSTRRQLAAVPAAAQPVLPGRDQSAVAKQPDRRAPVELGQLTGAVQTLADIIKFTPVHADGRLLGYRVAPGRAARLFDHFGLKRNDLITGVNGVALDDPTRALAIYRQLQGAKSARFELVRDGGARIVDIALDGDPSRG